MSMLSLLAAPCSAWGAVEWVTPVWALGWAFDYRKACCRVLLVTAQGAKPRFTAQGAKPRQALLYSTDIVAGKVELDRPAH